MNTHWKSLNQNSDLPPEGTWLLWRSKTIFPDEDWVYSISQSKGPTSESGLSSMAVEQFLIIDELD